ncbi:hypothetical protein MRX96_005820 [Rhipicephalus microplus]
MWLQGGRQLDVSLAWEYMYNYIATPVCAEHALALASQMSRRFFVDPLVKAETNGDSIGLFSTLAHLFEQANGRSFPKVKVWPAGEQWTAAAPVHLTWLGWYNIGQSGMLPEAAFAAPEGAAYPPGFDENLLGVSPFLAVCAASPTFRMARALGLIEGEHKLYLLRAELSLSIWLSGSAVVTASHIYTAALSLGLTWASINGLGLPFPRAVQATSLHVSAMTAKRVDNVVDSKRDLYINHATISFGALVPNIRTGGDWDLENVGGFPLLFFLLRSMFNKIKLELVEPGFTSAEEADIDGQGLTSHAAYVPSGHDWLFLPWFTSPLNWAGKAFGYTTSAPPFRRTTSRSGPDVLEGDKLRHFIGGKVSDKLTLDWTWAQGIRWDEAGSAVRRAFDGVRVAANYARLHSLRRSRYTSLSHLNHLVKWAGSFTGPLSLLLDFCDVVESTSPDASAFYRSFLAQVERRVLVASHVVCVPPAQPGGPGR